MTIDLDKIAITELLQGMVAHHDLMSNNCPNVFFEKAKTIIARDTPNAPKLPYRSIGYTAEECERDMRRMTGGARGCMNPDEHEGTLRTRH